MGTEAAHPVSLTVPMEFCHAQPLPSSSEVMIVLETHGGCGLGMSYENNSV